MVVRRASHSQNTPHVSRPHSAPTTSVTPMNSTPTSALAPARRSQPSECCACGTGTIADADGGDDERQVGQPDRRARGRRGCAPTRSWSRSAGEKPRPKRDEPGDADERGDAEQARRVGAGGRAVDGRRGGRGPILSSCRSTCLLFVDQRPEGQRTPDTEGDGEHGEQADPGPAVRDRRPAGAERRFDRSGCSDQDGRHHREQEQREQRLAPRARQRGRRRAYRRRPARRSRRPAS